MNDNLIAVTGATGQIGGRVASRLSTRQVPQRLIVRDAARAPALEDAEVLAVSGYGDGEGMQAALAGVHTLLLVSGAETPTRVADHITAIDAAVCAGVARIVYLSFLGAAPDAIFTLARDHFATEQAIRERGIDFCFLRDSLYLDVLPGMVGNDGVIRGPAGSGLLAGVARDDVADAAMAVLTEAGHEGRTYNLTGPDLFTLRDAAEIMAIRSGKPIRFSNETVEEAFESRAAPDVPQFLLNAWVTTYAAIRHGELDVRTDAVEILTGREPIGLHAVLDRLPEAFAHVTAATAEPLRRGVRGWPSRASR